MALLLAPWGYDRYMIRERELADLGGGAARVHPAPQEKGAKVRERVLLAQLASPLTFESGRARGTASGGERWGGGGRAWGCGASLV